MDETSLFMLKQEIEDLEQSLNAKKCLLEEIQTDYSAAMLIKNEGCLFSILAVLTAFIMEKRKYKFMIMLTTKCRYCYECTEGG
jgi:hypothetical protein